MSSYERTREIATGIRRRVLEQTIRANGGYLSQACSSAELLAMLYTHYMHLGPSLGMCIPAPFHGVPGARNTHHVNGGVYNGAQAPDFDRFILSPTHYAMTLYAALIETDRMDAEGLAMFNADGSSVEMIGGEHSPGLEVTGGSFGQAISQAAGVALARKLRGDTGRVWVFMSDGEFQEGQVWESVTVMAHHRIDNLRVVVDVNNQQVDGRMDDVMNIGSLHAKLEAFGAVAVEVDGHDLEALAEAGETPHVGRPLFILAKTIPYRGIDLLQERYPHLHYVRFRSDAERERYRTLLETL
jgi:transketolase